MKPRIFILPLFILFSVGLSAQVNTGYKSASGAARVPDAMVEVGPTADALQATLYELSSQYHAVQQMHWNLTGPLFISLHELYGEIYGGIAGQIDAVAERKLALDRPADARPSAVAANANLTAVPDGFVTDMQTLELLAARHETISDRLAQRISDTGETDPVTQDLLITVKYMIDEQLWKLRSHLK